MIREGRSREGRSRNSISRKGRSRKSRNLEVMNRESEVGRVGVRLRVGRVLVGGFTLTYQ